MKLTGYPDYNPKAETNAKFKGVHPLLFGVNQANHSGLTERFGKRDFSVTVITNKTILMKISFRHGFAALFTDPFLLSQLL